MNITEIESLPEAEAKNLAEESAVIKGYNIYFVDLGGYYGYSVLFYKNNHAIYHANDYELHHKGRSKEELRTMYEKRANNIMFTDDEIISPIKTYDEYNTKRNFLHNYYAMSEDYISIFHLTGTTEEEAIRKKKLNTEYKYFNAVGFCYMKDKAFVDHHMWLLEQLVGQEEKRNNDYEYLKAAFMYEMYNHEYAINYYQRNWDTLSCFGDIEFVDSDDMHEYFKQLGFNDVQKKAYIDARREVLAKEYA